MSLQDIGATVLPRSAESVISSNRVFDNAARRCPDLCTLRVLHFACQCPRSEVVQPFGRLFLCRPMASIPSEEPTIVAGAYSLTALTSSRTSSEATSSIVPSAISNDSSNTSFDPTTDSTTSSHTSSPTNSHANSDVVSASWAGLGTNVTSCLAGPSGAQAEWMLQRLLHRLQRAWSALGQGSLKSPIAAITWLCSGLKTVFFSYGRITVMLGMILATIYSIPAWKGLQLQTWTSRKDFFEYCQAELVCLAVSVELNPQRAVKHAGAETVSMSIKPPHGARESLFAASSRHVILTWLFWCGAFICIFTQCERVARGIRRIRPGHNGYLVRLLLFIFPVPPIEWFVIFILIEHIQWTQSEQLRAEVAYQVYCDSLPVCLVSFSKIYRVLI
jgi:hypothetical protein